MAETSSDEDRQILQEMVGRYAAPSFIRRAKLVENTWNDLLARGVVARNERLVLVRLRLGQLFALAGAWDTVGAWLPVEGELERLKRLHDELQPCLRLPLEATTSPRRLRSAANELTDAMTMFNERWTRWLSKVELKAINQAREDYNRFYLFEKECAVGSARVARIGFTKLAPVTPDDILRELPLLIVPKFHFK